MALPFRLEPTEDSVRLLKAAIEGALHEEGVELEIPSEYTGVTGFYDHNIKINKIAYRAIEEFDLPLLRTWYKYGQYEPYAELRPKSMDVSPQTNTEEYAYTSQKRTVTQEDIIDYLVGLDLEDIFQQNTFEFLVSNYEGLAPEEYKQTYISSTKIIEILDGISNDSLSELEDNISRYREDFKQASIDLRYEIENNSTFDSEVQTFVERFLMVFEDALVALEDDFPLDASIVENVREGRRIYHEYVWPLAALNISLKEARGPKEDVERLASKGEDQLEQGKKDASLQLRGWEDTLEDAGLTPSIAAHRRVYSGNPAPLNELSEAAIRFDE